MPSFVFITDKNPAPAKFDWRRMPDPIVPVGISGKQGETKGSDYVLKWHCGIHAPIDTFENAKGDAAFLIGDAIEESSDRRLTAERIIRMIAHSETGSAAEALSRYSGFFAWLVIQADGSVEIGSDPFGTFPIYYFHAGKAFGLSTSLEALHAHPSYDSTIDPVGLSQSIIENGCSGTRTPETAGRRLDIAESLRWEPSDGQLRRTQHRHPGKDTEKVDLSADEAVELSLELSRSALRRHIGETCDSILLSGGLDSRQLAAFVAELGRKPLCMTLGRADSDEALCARAVAKHLGFPWTFSGGFQEDPRNVLRDELNLFSLGAGFNALTLWSSDSAWSRGARCLSGTYLDVAYSPFMAYKMRDAPPGSFESVRDGWANHFGVRYTALESMYCDPHFKDSVREAMDTMRREWTRMRGDPTEVIWQSIVRYRGRPHLGAVLWKNAFHSWPITPGLDVPLMEGIRTIPSRFFKDRWIQKATFQKLRPDLASIPLASFGSRPKPIVKNLRSRYLKRKWSAQRSFSRHFAKFPQAQSPDAGHIACWQVAEQFVWADPSKWESIFERSAVERYLAEVSPHAVMGKNGDYSAGRRMLVGALSWLSAR